MRPRQTMLLTQCPACQTAFRLTLDDLAIAAGQVQCGHCQHIFNAIEHGAEESRLSGEDSLPERPSADIGLADDFIDESGLDNDFIDENALAELGVDEDALDDAFLDENALAELGVNEDALAEAGVNEEELDEIFASVVTEFPAFTDQTNPVGENASIDTAEAVSINGVAVDPQLKRSTGFAVDRTLLVSGLLTLLFLAQVTMIFSENLLANRYTRSWLEAGCEIFNCAIPAFIDIDSLTIKESEISPLDSMGQRLITARLHNSADLAQPLPDLLLELTNASGATVAHRVFDPGEYLTEASDAGFVGAGDSLPLSLPVILAESNLSVLGYRLQLKP
ncbi:MAG: DUF3426 domain-containing protein [Gammaproteobacteria bacterium]|jgi:predicted Zn finger-like uncharacterized protein|nr:DUF3426 domain-containing protein [Gammaproteobacteria bacterium]MBT5203169.1 DUF3426 domain-containing protein [Gammaproteobacteria bacterium]MBT5601503.1 DUF3426 domain-containing protein [Gammaproteobacteria bacterium]MBT6244080.1 DUF3426 domain-containing protein [Gammaproteobacteria bacterium]